MAKRNDFFNACAPAMQAVFRLTWAAHLAYDGVESVGPRGPALEAAIEATEQLLAALKSLREG